MMTVLLASALGVFIALGVVSLAGGLVAVLAFRRLTQSLESELGQNPTQSLSEWLFGLRVRNLETLSFTMQRAESGDPAHHPLGSRPRFSLLKGEVGFDPATLGPWPVDGTVPVETETLIGPRARRPLLLRTPIMVAPMGYGVGLTREAKAALAEASTLAGTAIVTGEGPFLPEERALAHRFVLQWSRADWAHQPEIIALSDMVEIQVGQGSEAAAAIAKKRGTLPARVRRFVDESKVRIHAPAPTFVESAMAAIRTANPDCPIAVKIPATQHLEMDLAYLLDVGADVITLDGNAAGSADSPAVISDHFGIDIALAVHRAHRFLRARGLVGQVSLVAGGGVVGAADAALLIALGADAVVVGTSLVFAMSHEQVYRVLPGFPPTSLVFTEARAKRTPPHFDREAAAEHAANWLRATTEELTLIARTVGVTAVHDLSRAHLVARSKRAHEALGVTYNGVFDPRDTLVRGVGQLAEDYTRATAMLTRIFELLTVRP